MDPTVDVLTIYPAAWAALFSGLAEGLIFGLVGLATAALVLTVLAVALGNLICRLDEGPDEIGLAALAGQSANNAHGIIVQLAAVRQRRQQEQRRA